MGRLDPDVIDDYVEHFRARVLQDAIAEALPRYWLHRAQQFEWAMSRPGDAHGSDSDEVCRAQRDAELEALAAECRKRASARERLDSEWWEPLIKEALRGGEAGP